MILLGLVALLWVFQSAVQAADVSPSSNILAYTMDSGCPSGWSDLSSDDTYKGRLIKGYNSASNLGLHSSGAITNNDVPYHNHGQWSRRLVLGGSKRTSWLINSGPRMLDDIGDHWLNQDTGGVNWQPTNIQRVSLRLCYFTSGLTFNLPPGFVVFVHHTRNTCPGGFVDFADGNGRFLVFAAPGKDMSNNLNSPAAPATCDRCGIGEHAHWMPQITVQMRYRNAAIGTGCCGPYASPWNEWRTLEGGWTSNSHLNIPYVQLRSCRAQDTTGTLRLPNPRLIFFFDGQNCPALYREATTRTDGGDGFTPFSNMVGRMIFNLFDFNTYPGQVNTGGDILYCAFGGCGNGQGNHAHWVTSNFNLPAQGSGGWWDTCCTDWTHFEGYSWGWGTDGSNVGSLFPYRVMRACSAQLDTAAPTKQPSKSPTTSRPSTTPTTSFPTRDPTRSPTLSAPSHGPTKNPTRSPTTSRPSRTPTTSSPSSTPTTSRPTVSPSDAPTMSPTPSPVWRDVCSPSDVQVFVDYDNYVIQAARCSSDCRGQILGGEPQAAKVCIDNCLTLSLYTPVCRGCMIFWMMTQDEKCRGPCLASKFSAACAQCTNQWSRPDFRICTGFQASDVSLGGGDGGANAPKDEGINAGLVSGAALGGLLAIAGALFVGRKIRDRMLLDSQLAKEMEMNIFKNGTSGAPPPPPPAKTKFFLSPFSSKKKAETEKRDSAKNSLVADEGTRESIANPMYSHPSKQPERIKETTVTAGVMLRTRYSFHGKEVDELDVPAGATLVAIEKNNDWYVCQDERTGKYGLIPASYVSAV